MNGYERIIRIIREQGSVNNPATLQLGEMTSENTCEIGDLKLDADDLYIAQHLIEHEIEIDTENENNKKIKVHGTLEKGDLVLVQRINDEKYTIIEKLMEVG